MTKYDLRDRCYKFSVNIVKFVNTVSVSLLSKDLLKQLIRSGTSFGANMEEADSSATRKDLKYKLTLSLKEAAETSYWLRLIIDSSLLKNDDHLDDASKLLDECGQIVRIFSAITRKL